MTLFFRRGPLIQPRSRAGTWLSALALLVACGCHTADSALNSCARRHQVPLLGATPDDGLSAASPPPAQRLAIGAIERPLGRLVCTGTVIAPGWVLTAGHCAEPSAVMWFRTSAVGTPAILVQESRRFVHDHRDVMLLELQSGAALHPLAAALPVPPLEGDLGPAWLGRVVTLAGLGTTEAGTSGVRHFADEPITAVEGDIITVDGAGQRGACGGDSGGPLLTVTADKTAQVIGVLSGGAASCLGLDRFERLDSLRAWIDETIATARAHPCGGMTEEGRCASGVSTWCAAGGVTAEPCAAPQACGWNAAARGYRCVDPVLDPCAGVGPVPECRDDRVVRCQQGQLVEEDCARCGQRCVQSAAGEGGCG